MRGVVSRTISSLMGAGLRSFPIEKLNEIRDVARISLSWPWCGKRGSVRSFLASFQLFGRGCEKVHILRKTVAKIIFGEAGPARQEKCSQGFREKKRSISALKVSRNDIMMSGSNSEWHGSRPPERAASNAPVERIA